MMAYESMRGALVTVAMQGDFGKPRPALVIQADQFSVHPSVTVLPVTSMLVAAPLLRVTIEPTPENGLQKPSQVMVDKVLTVKREKLGPPIGRIDMAVMVQVERCLAVFLGIAK
ncbi:putative endoribonuclease MazF [compost metagenome]